MLIHFRYIQILILTAEFIAFKGDLFALQNIVGEMLLG